VLVRSDEHDRRRVPSLAYERRRLDAAQAGHLDVEEHDVVPLLLRQPERFRRRCRLPDDAYVRVLREQVPELGARRRLVVDEQRPDHGRRSGRGKTGTSSRTTVPNGNERSWTPAP
jgi:hypothetical protein